MTTAPTAPDSNNAFDPGPHIYTIDKKIVDSVTGVLADNNLIDLRWFDEKSRLRGTRVHIGTHYMDEGDLDWNTVLPQDIGFLRSWDLLKLRNKIEIISVEDQVYDPLYMFAGTYDRILTMHGSSTRWSIDIKTVGDGKGKPPFWAKYQTGSYEGTYRKMHGGDMMRRGAVVLQEDGSLPRIYEYRDSSDYADFLAMSQSTKIRRTHKRELTIRTE